MVTVGHQKIGTQWKWKLTPMEKSSMVSITAIHLQKSMPKRFSWMMISLVQSLQALLFQATHFPILVAEMMAPMELFEFAILNGCQRQRLQRPPPQQQQQRP